MATALTSELTRFTDKCNNVLAGGIVKTFEPNSLTPKTSYQDPECTIPNFPEVVLDETGRAKIYIQGDYRIQVYSRDGVLIEDNLLVEQTLVQRDFVELSQSLQIEQQETLNQFQAQADEVIAQGFYTGYATETALKASLPAVSEMRARADDTRKIWRWNRTSAVGVTPITGTWIDTGLSDLDQSKDYTDQKTKKSVQGLAGKNLFNLNASGVAIGYFPNNTTGNLQANASYNTSDFIPVTAGLSYSVSTKHYWSWYNSSKVFISGTSDANNNKTQVAPAGAAYMRASAPVMVWSTFQVEQSSSPTSYEAYSPVISVDPISLKDDTIAGSKLTNFSVKPEKVNFLQPTKNLFNKLKATIGYAVSNANGNLFVSANYDTSDFIPVSANTQYWGQGGLQGMRFIAFYDAAKASIAGGSGVDTNTFTTTAGTAYVRISVYHVDIDSFQLELGAAKTSFIPFGYNIRLLDGIPIYLEQASNVSTWKDKSWATLGDSITAGATWQIYVSSKLGLIQTNFGSGGTKISGVDSTAMCQDARINAIPTTIDLVSLMGGTNDWAQNITLGAIDSIDPLTFYGALNTFAQKAFTRWPTKRITVATTPYGEIVDWTGRAGWTSPAHNSLGLTTNDYAEAIRQFCKRKNLHCIDVALSAGWGTYNITEALGGSTTDHLHPASGSNAAKGIGAAYIKGLKDIEPI